MIEIEGAKLLAYEHLVSAAQYTRRECRWERERFAIPGFPLRERYRRRTKDSISTFGRNVRRNCLLDGASCYGNFETSASEFCRNPDRNYASLREGMNLQRRR